MRITLSCLVALLFAGCPTDPDPCGPPCDAGPPIDAPRPDAPGLDAPGTDAPGTDAPGTDAPIVSGCTLPQPFDVGVTYTRTIHVAVGGTGDGSSAASAMGDIEAALRMATPGTEVLVQPGVYAGDLYVDGIVGTAAAPIALRVSRARSSRAAARRSTSRPASTSSSRASRRA